MKPRVKLLIVVVLTAVVVGGMAYYMVNKNATADKNDLQAQITDLEKKVADREAVEDATSKWQTYSNQEFNFSFRYPVDWKIEDATTAYREPDIVGAFNLVPSTIQNDAPVAVIVRATTLTSAIQNAKDTYAFSSTFLGESTTSIGGVAASKLSFQNKKNENIKPVLYCFEKNGYVYELDGEGSSDKLDSPNNEIAYNLIRTFQFIN